MRTCRSSVLDHWISDPRALGSPYCGSIVFPVSLDAHSHCPLKGHCKIHFRNPFTCLPCWRIGHHARDYTNPLSLSSLSYPLLYRKLSMCSVHHCSRQFLLQRIRCRTRRLTSVAPRCTLIKDTLSLFPRRRWMLMRLTLLT